MHSSRMHTARLLTVSEGGSASGGLHPGGLPTTGGSASRGVCPTLESLPNLGGGSAQPWGGVCPTAWVCIGRVCIWGESAFRRVCPTPEGLHLGGGSASGGPPPPVNRMMHRCKNITLPQTSFTGGKNTTQHSYLNTPVNVASMCKE